MRWLGVALLLGIAGCTVFDPMQLQQKYKPYRRSEFYPDGVSMRAPPDGTVSRERMLDPVATTGRAPDGTPVQTVPIPVTRQLLEVGRKRFEINCATCHGLLGDGKSLVARNMSLRAPPSLHRFVGFPDGWYYQVIAQGFGLMPSYAGVLTVEERWAVIAYVRALQISQSRAIGDAPPDVRARLGTEKTP